METDLLARDLRHIWHPCSQMKDHETFKLLEIVGAQGCFLELRDGKKIIDAISSWWCKSLGHGHPRLKRAISRQLEKFEHVILANTTNDTIVALSEKLTRLSPALSKVFYASDGSCAIEIAMKMSLHARQIQGDTERNLFLALENGYHGETIGALSVSDVGIYREPYASLLFDVELITALPYVSGIEDPVWLDCEEHWLVIEKQLEKFSDVATAIIVEPIVQGAGGMKIYSQDFLKRLRAWTAKRGIHVIADEIMTGIGRTGKMLACEHAGITPDFLCLSKGLTSGWLPLSAVLTRDEIYQVFYDDYGSGKSFLHSHTYSGNVLAASVAVEVLNIMREENICAKVNDTGRFMLEQMTEIANTTKKLANVRGIGAIVAADLITDSAQARAGYEVFRRAVELGAFLRPIGNTIYWLPPLNIEREVVMLLKEITQEALSQ